MNNIILILESLTRDELESIAGFVILAVISFIIVILYLFHKKQKLNTRKMSWLLVAGILLSIALSAYVQNMPGVIKDRLDSQRAEEIRKELQESYSKTIIEDIIDEH